MKTYHIYDSDKLTYKGVIKGNLSLMSNSTLLWIVSLVAALLLITQAVVHRVEIKRLTKSQQLTICHINDSLSQSIDSIMTLAEIGTIHNLIGQVVIDKDARHKKHNEKPPTKEEVWEFVKLTNAWYPEYIMAQALLESGCGSMSPQGTNNLFGMTIPSRRETTASNVGSGERYAKYKHWKLSVIDRVLYELYVFKNHKPTREKYVQQLTNYAEDGTYTAKIEKIAENWRKKP